MSETKFAFGGGRHYRHIYITEISLLHVAAGQLKSVEYQGQNEAHQPINY